MKKLLLLIPILIFANVFVKVNKNKIYKGEELIVTIQAEGKDIVFPKIDSISNYHIVGKSSSTNLIIINGDAKEIKSISFTIYPDKNLTIPSFTVKVDGKIYKTKPIFVEVVSPKQSKGDFELDINLSKNKVYLGEDVILDIKFKFKKKFYSLNIIPPKIENFIFKQISQIKKDNEIDAKFLLIPQKTGNYKLQFRANIGFLVKKQDPFFNDPFFSITEVKYKPIFSNEVTLNVLPIPNNAIYADFNISIKAKKRPKANEVNKVFLTLKGCGDFANLKDFKLNISNVTIYEKKPIIKTNLKNNKLCGSYVKEFDIIADRNYTIPAITLNEINKTISTKPIKVEVINSNVVNHLSQNNKTTTPTQTKKEFNFIYILVLIAGIIIGSLITYFLKREKTIIDKIKRANEKELFNLLIPYKENPKIKEILQKLEENIYKNAHHKIDKKEIIRIIKNYL